MKICAKCKISKLELEFSKQKNSLDGLFLWCKKCAAESSRRYRINNPEKVKAAFKKWRSENLVKAKAAFKKWKLKSYGLSLAEFEKMLAEQGGNCRICEQPMTPPYVDHCHKTGEVRGLLCRDCNLGLGSFKDSRKALIAAEVYLAVYEKP